jgi:cellulose synthase/poly-beta-1,6-N-acetylglucosamine synthase-like glycosyltransferase
MPNDSPLVSVVIPAHNSAALLPGAIFSVQQQSLQDLELLLVDDGSTDATWDVMQRAAAVDARIRVIRRERNGGVSAARNEALRQARGRYVAFLDHDDAFLPTRLECLVGAAEALGADLMADDLRRYDGESGSPLGRHLGLSTILSLPQPISAEALVAHDMPGQGSGRQRAIGYLKPILRRDFLMRHGLQFLEGVHGAEDLLLYFECVIRGARLHVSRDAHYLYAVAVGSLSNRPGLARHQAAANRRMLRLATERGQAKLVRMLRRRQAVFDHAALVDATREGRWVETLRYARWGEPAGFVHDMRVVAGAARRRIARPACGALDARAPSV